MSTAEQVARKVYNEYHLGELPTDVKRQLIILFLNSPSIISQEKDGEEEDMPQISAEALRQRAEKSFHEAKEGLITCCLVAINSIATRFFPQPSTH